MQTYDPSKNYNWSPGLVVEHNGKLYKKLDDGDNSAPDDVPGGWVEVPKDETNISEYLTIEAQLSSFEARAKEHQEHLAAERASAEAKLKALGLTVDELKALGL